MTERIKRHSDNTFRTFNTEKPKINTRTRANKLREGMQFSYKPQIDENSRLMAKKSHRHNTPVYERLYANNPKASANKNSKSETKNRKASSKNQSSFTLKQYTNEKTRSSQLQLGREDTQASFKQTHSNINDKHLINKFLKEFNKATEGLTIPNNGYLNFNIIEQLMAKLGFGHTSNKEYEKVLIRMFNTLDLQNKRKVHITHLKHFIAGVLNIDLDMKKTSRELQEIYKEYKLLYYIRQSNSDKILRKKQLNKIKRYVHKLATPTRIKHIDRYTCPSESTFKPKMNKSYIREEEKDVAAKKGLEKDENDTSKPLKTVRHKKASTMKIIDSLIEKSIERMRKGREDRERKRRMLKTSDNRKHMVFNMNENKRSPILRIEVNIGGRVEELFVFKTDAARKLAKSLAVKHSNFYIKK